MSPVRIVKQARECGLDMIAICDHNAAENVTYARAVGEKTGVAVIRGMEITSREEVHVLGLFDSNRSLKHMADWVYENLPGVNDEHAFGAQYVADEEDYVVDVNPHLLIGATTLSLGEIVERIHREGGLAIASHIDREGFGIIGQLGFIPPGLELDALEVSPRMPMTVAQQEFSEYSLPIITSSDAHCLADIGKSRTGFLMEAPCVSELRKALRAEAGREVVS